MGTIYAHVSTECLRPKATLHALGLDPDTPFDPATQRCVVVDVCGTCGGNGVRLDPDSVGRAFAAVLGEGRGAGVKHLRCPDCEGRGWTVPT